MDEDKAYYCRRLNKHDGKMLDSLNKCSVKCKKCNRSVVISKRDRALCPDCGNWVYKNDMLEFKYKLEEQMKKRRNDK